MTSEAESRLLADVAGMKVTLSNQDKVLSRLDRAILGNGKPGLIVEVDRNKRSIRFMRLVAWAVFAPLLGGIGTGLAAVIIHLANKH